MTRLWAGTFGVQIQAGAEDLPSQDHPDWF
jgi:hypothetical protein